MPRRTRHTRLTHAIAAAAFVGSSVAVGAATPAAATPADPADTVADQGGSYVTRTEALGDQRMMVYVHSAAMGREIPLEVWRPADTGVPRPTLYLLNGAGGGEDKATWQLQTDAFEFLRDKNVNVVLPTQGAWSYYTDWIAPDPELGVNKWETFLTREVPPLINATLGTDGRNAIAGLSSSGTSVLQLAIAAPGLYRGVAAYSGCAQTSDPIGRQFVRTVVEVGGGADADNMWGPDDSPVWAEKDPLLHAEGLRGLDLFVSTGSGLPGPYDTLDGPGVDGRPSVLAGQLVVGGPLEAATNFCTHNLRTRLDELGIPATYSLRPTGSHSWGYWQDDLKDSWPVLDRALHGA